MSQYLPDLEKLATLGFAPPQALSAGFTPSLTYHHEAHPFWAVVVWPNEGTVRLTRQRWNAWRACFTGPVSDEAAFDTLVQQHFPELTP